MADAAEAWVSWMNASCTNFLFKLLVQTLRYFVQVTRTAEQSTAQAREGLERMADEVRSVGPAAPFAGTPLTSLPSTPGEGVDQVRVAPDASSFCGDAQSSPMVLPRPMRCVADLDWADQVGLYVLSLRMLFKW